MVCKIKISRYFLSVRVPKISTALERIVSHFLHLCVVCIITIYAVFTYGLFCHDLPCFDANLILLQFTHFCVEQKLTQKSCSWSKNDKYHVWMKRHPHHDNDDGDENDTLKLTMKTMTWEIEVCKQNKSAFSTSIAWSVTKSTTCGQI